ncbi:hypothetical protein SDC9_137253 [bioreactor metagenome]|uniref:Uncharacterized protein n=1 Tax=bioreactor metagenome TaxID=1076179 RepID=A0A645DLD5_9ZZZZ
MFFLVPDPALLLLIDETTSAYVTSAALFIAATIGTVACPAQVTKFTLSPSSISCVKLTEGTT